MNLKIDDAILTIQGKRTPGEPSLKLSILSVWGRVQLYVFVFLAVIVIYSLYRTLQTARTKELRYFGFFLFIVLLPIFLHGVGSFGILTGLTFLQGFSITTNEFVTLLWAIGIYVALLIARSGFNQVEDTIMTLRKNKEDLEHSNRLKDIFTDIMRHDLLNPIGMVRSYVELLREEPLEPAAREYVEIISTNSERASEMIEGASSLAKLEDVSKLELKEIDINKILKHVVEDFEERAAQKNITIETNSEDSKPALVNEILYDAFSNLISNAIKYSPEGSKVKVGIEDSGSEWRVSVSDRGEGVPDEFKNDIFDRFTRIHKGGVEGTGLGLTITKRIVELHMGRVWVEDNPGGGSIFIITIPKPAD